MTDQRLQRGNHTPVRGLQACNYATVTFHIQLLREQEKLTRFFFFKYNTFHLIFNSTHGMSIQCKDYKKYRCS